ncbi:MAG: hypothetical protein ACLSG5_10685 [Oscillospiraceae bacterium]
MSKKKRAVFIVVWVALMVIVLVAALLVGGSGESESIKVVMRDAVLHGTNKVSLFGIKDVNPAYISSLIVCGALLVFAAVIRIFVIPKFKMVLEVPDAARTAVTFFDNLAKTSSPHKNSFLGAYVFAAGVYIFVGTCSSCSAFRRRPPQEVRFPFRLRCLTSTPLSCSAACPTS